MKHIVTQEDIDTGRFTGVEVGHEMELVEEEIAVETPEVEA